MIHPPPRIFKAVEFQARWPIQFFNFFRITFVGLGVFGFLSAKLISLFPSLELSLPLAYLDGLYYLFFPLGISLGFFGIFIDSYLKNPRLKEGLHPIEYLDFTSAKILNHAATISKKNESPITTRIILSAMAISSSIPFHRSAIHLDSQCENLFKELDQFRQEHGHEKIMLVNSEFNGKYFWQSHAPRPAVGVDLAYPFDQSSGSRVADLNQAQVSKIAKNYLIKLKEDLEKQNYNFIFDDNLVNYVVHLGHDPQLGTLPIGKLIKNTIELAISKKITRGEIRRGQEFTLPLHNFKDLC